MNRPSARATRGQPARSDGSDWARAGRGRAARERSARTAPRDGAARPRETAADGDPGPRGTAPSAGRARRRPPVPDAAGTEAGPGGSGKRPRLRRASGASRSSPVAPRYRRRRFAAGLLTGLVLLVAVGVGGALLLHRTGLAAVRDVTITGLSTVPEPAVRDAVGLAPGGPLIAVDTAGIARRVAAVEGVASVEVHRAWPHTVEVDVTERVPVALWPTPQGLFEVDATGLPYRRAPDPPPPLPRLAFAGVGPQDPATAAGLAVLRELGEPLRAQVATVTVAGSQVTLGLTGDRTVRWGDPDRNAEKNAVLGPLLGQPGSVYDVSSPDLPTVRP